MPKTYGDMIQVIGRTPLVRLSGPLAVAGVELLAKLEYKNPLGSVKDRIGAAMIEGRRKGRPHRPRDDHRGNPPAATPGSGWPWPAWSRATGWS